MFYVVAILIAGLWAAFLLPTFIDHRSRATRATTRDFARSKELLENVATTRPEGSEYLRYHRQLKRRRILVGLFSTAFLSLVVATWTGSVAWLWLTIAFDVLSALYVGLLLYIRKQSLMEKAAVVTLETIQDDADRAVLTSVPEYEEIPTVRIIAG